MAVQAGPDLADDCALGQPTEVAVKRGPSDDERVRNKKGEGARAPSPLSFSRSSVDQGATSVPILLGACPTGMTAISFIATVSIAVTELRAALEM